MWTSRGLRHNMKVALSLTNRNCQIIGYKRKKLTLVRHGHRGLGVHLSPQHVKYMRPVMSVMASNAALPPIAKISMIGIWIETALYGMSRVSLRVCH